MILNTKLCRQLINYTSILRFRRALCSNLISQPKRSYIGCIGWQCTNLESLHRTTLIFQSHNYCTKHNRDLAPTEVKALIEAKSIYLIDVREPHELVEEGKINGCVNIPLGKIVEALSMEDDDYEATYGTGKPVKDHANVVFYCKGGVRSDHAMKAALSLGFNGARHLIGGIDEWKVSNK